MAKFIRIHDNVDNEVAINIESIRQYNYLHHTLRIGDDNILVSRQNEITKIEQIIDSNSI